MRRIIVLLTLLFSLQACNTWYHPYSAEVEDLSIDSSVVHEEKNDSLHALIQDYKVELDNEMNQIIGSTARQLSKGKPESLLGNFVADLILEHGKEIIDEKVDFAITNYGGLRLPDLPKGKITRSKVYELMPFDNYIVVLRLPGTAVQMFCDKIASEGGWPVSEGLQFAIDNNRARNISINGNALERDQFYAIATINYLASGGDDCSFLTDYDPIAQGKFLRDIILEKFEEKKMKSKSVNAHIENRITTKP